MSLLRRSRRPRACCVRSLFSRTLLPRACRLKPSGPRSRAWHMNSALVDGTTAAALRSARGVPQAGFAAGRPPLICTDGECLRAVGARVRPRGTELSRAVVRARGTGIRVCVDAVPTGRRDHRYRLVVRSRRAPPSAHLDVSGRAPAVNPQGVDCRRHAAAGAKPCVRMGAPNPPATGRALSALTKPERYVQSIHARAAAEDAVL